MSKDETEYETLIDDSEYYEYYPEPSKIPEKSKVGKK
jgi:hypothetical protein